jgi:hypothetical protein
MNKRYDITFVGLKQGSHQFRFEIGKSFFEEFPYSIVEEGNLIAELDLDKKRNNYDCELFCQRTRTVELCKMQ